MGRGTSSRETHRPVVAGACATPRSRARRVRSGEAGRRVLAQFGVNVDAPVEQYEAAYAAFLPTAQGRGYYALLRDAQLVEGRVVEWSVDDELTWLAANLHVGDGQEPAWWAEVWRRAVTAANRTTTRLTASERERLVRLLHERPDHREALFDAVVDALRLNAA